MPVLDLVDIDVDDLHDRVIPAAMDVHKLMQRRHPRVVTVQNVVLETRLRNYWADDELFVCGNLAVVCTKAAPIWSQGAYLTAELIFDIGGDLAPAKRALPDALMRKAEKLRLVGVIAGEMTGKNLKEYFLLNGYTTLMGEERQFIKNLNW
jgi:hypothetical protein